LALQSILSSYPSVKNMTVSTNTLFQTVLAVTPPFFPFSSGATRLADEKNAFAVIYCNANGPCSGMP
jgi:hypothetical protein